MQLVSVCREHACSTQGAGSMHVHAFQLQLLPQCSHSIRHASLAAAAVDLLLDVLKALEHVSIVHKAEGHVLTFKYIIQVEELLFIIQIITASILLVAWAFGCSPSVKQMRVKVRHDYRTNACIAGSFLVSETNIK